MNQFLSVRIFYIYIYIYIYIYMYIYREMPKYLSTNYLKTKKQREVAEKM